MKKFEGLSRSLNAAEMKKIMGGVSETIDDGQCTARCTGGLNVSCTGKSCSAEDDKGVTCDGVLTPCKKTE